MKKTLLYIAALVVGISSLFVLVTGHASAATATWDGGGSDNNMLTAANWTGDVAPSTNADLVFPATISKKTVTNNFTAGTSFTSITFSGTTLASEVNYAISGNSMNLTAGITTDFDGRGGSPTLSLPLILAAQAFVTSLNNTITLSGTVGIGSNTVIFDGAGNTTISGVLSGSGAVIKDGTGTMTLSGANTTYSGVVTDGMGVVTVANKDALGTAAGATNVNNGAQLAIMLPQAQKVSTIAEPFTIHAETYDPGVGDLLGVFTVNAACSLSACQDSDITLSGVITTTTDVQIETEATVRLTGTLSGTHTYKLSEGQYGTLIMSSSSNGSSTANGSYEAQAVTKTFAGTVPSQSINIYKNVTALVTGTYGNVHINKLGTLKGTGTIGTLFMSDGGTLAPGASPGILNSGNVSFSGGSQQEELGGTAAGTYDQLNVTGTVDLGSTTNLTVSLYNGYAPAVGDSYTIINNDGSDAIVGHFTGLPEGTTFKVGGRLFRITYTGGDGNDVALVVQPIPTTPDTGFQLLHSNPLLSMTLLCAATPMLMFAARRTARVTVK